MSRLVKPENLRLQTGDSLAHGLVTLYGFEHGGGNQIGHSLNGETAALGDAAFEIDGAVGPYGRAIALDGTSEWLAVDQGALIFRQTGGFTISATVRVHSNSGEDYFYSEGSSSSGTPFWGLGVVGTNTIRFFLRSDAGATWYSFSGTTLTIDKWHVITVVVPPSADDATVYLDGKQVASLPDAIYGTALTLDRGTIGALGRTGVGNYADADIAQIAGWSRSLLPGEVSRHRDDPWRMVRPRRRLVAAVAGGTFEVNPVPVTIVLETANPSVDLTFVVNPTEVEIVIETENPSVDITGTFEVNPVPVTIVIETENPSVVLGGLFEVNPVPVEITIATTNPSVRLGPCPRPFMVPIDMEGNELRDAAYPLVPITVDTTLDTSHTAVFVDASGGPVKITMPTAVGIRGRTYTVKKADTTSNPVTIEGDGSETVERSSTLVLTLPGTSLDLMSDNANWSIT